MDLARPFDEVMRETSRRFVRKNVNLARNRTTERPITLTQGTNRLVRREDIGNAVREVLSGAWPNGTRPDLWDGKTAERVAQSLRNHLSG